MDDYDPTGKRPVALLMLTVEELESEKSIRFEEDHDDLDALRWAAVQVASGASYAFVWHANSGDEVQVLGDPDNTDLEELARALGVPIGAIVAAQGPR